jgi:hypothetical protein
MKTSTVVSGLLLMASGVLLGWSVCLGVFLLPVGYIILIIGLVQSGPKDFLQKSEGDEHRVFRVDLMNLLKMFLLGVFTIIALLVFIILVLWNIGPIPVP